MNLKPCPFCSSENIGTRTRSKYVVCQECGASGPIAFDYVRAWNTRPIEDELWELEGLRDVCCMNCEDLLPEVRKALHAIPSVQKHHICRLTQEY